MSYAQVASSGPKQSPEEARAPPPPQIEHSDNTSIASTVDVDSPHVISVSSSYHGETDTQLDRERREEEAEEREERAELEHEAAEAKAKGKAKAKHAADKANKEYEKLKTEAKHKGREVRDRVEEKGQDLNANRDNPVVVGNALVLGLGGALLGYGAYRKYSAGELNWKVAGSWAGVIGLFALGDYYLSQWLFKNKYPRK